MVVGAKVCELTDGFLWFVCVLNVGILTSSLTMSRRQDRASCSQSMITISLVGAELVRAMQQPIKT